MSSARSELLDRLAVFKDSLTESAIADGTPADTKKNDVARMLRSGLAVLAFAITEAFIRDRTGEALRSFSNVDLKFNDLSEKLQQAVTISAMQGVLFRSKYQEKINQISWILGELPLIANAASNISHLSPYAFGQASSNLSEEDLTNILAAFGVGGGWAAISEVAKRIGLGGVLDYAQTFKELARRRHVAAHDVSVKIPLNDLNESVNIILGICCSFDLLLSHALAKHNIKQIPNKKNGLIKQTDLKLRFISPHPTDSGKFRERVEKSNGAGLHTIKIHSSRSVASKVTLPKARGLQEHVIFLGGNGFPEQWETWM